MIYTRKAYSWESGGMVVCRGGYGIPKFDTMKKQYVVVFYVSSDLTQTETVEQLKTWGDSVELPNINISDVHIDELYDPAEMSGRTLPFNETKTSPARGV